MEAELTSACRNPVPSVIPPAIKVCYYRWIPKSGMKCTPLTVQRDNPQITGICGGKHKKVR